MNTVIATSLNEFPPEAEMLVHPVYLAGRGDTSVIYDALCDTRGWGRAITATGLVYTSPCQTVHVAYLPERRYGGWKVTQYREPLGVPIWSARFSENTPAEITSAFTTALAEGLGSTHLDHLHAGTDHPATGPSDVLVERGWSHDSNAMYQYLYSPDGHSYLSLRTYHLDGYDELSGNGPAQWTMYGCVEQVNGERWHADFTSDTPTYLLTRSALALSSPEPVERLLRDIPYRNLPYVTARPAAPGSHPRQTAALTRTPHARRQLPSAPTQPATAPITAPAPAPARHR